MPHPQCPECQAIATQLRATLRELIKSSRESIISSAEMQASIAELFSSDEKVARLRDSFQNSAAGLAYAQWTEHRIATGHVGAVIMPSFN